MVQRKAPPQPEVNMRSHVKKLERHPSCSQSQQHQQDSRTKGGGGGDLKKKKMMKLERSIRAADLESLQGSPLQPKRTSPIKRSPNYMKPTSSSDARKEKMQVTSVHPQLKTDEKMRSPKKTNNLNPSSPSPLKTLSRQSSLKAVIKNLKGVVVVNRATCSSTLKESKFPKALDLSPGGTEAEGTSLFKVCPYSYCSLNGHRHEALPPLRCFMSTRRKLLKTQKSLKLRALPSIRRMKVSEKDKERLDRGKEEALDIDMEISPESTEEVPDDDFFIEIYTGEPQGHVVNEIINSQNEYGAEEEEDRVGDVEEGKCSSEGKEDQKRETCTDAIVDDDDLGQNSESSNEEMDTFSMRFLEYVECDEQEDAKEENVPCLVTEDYGESCVPDASSKASESMGESENKVSTFDFDWEEELKGLFSDNTMESSGGTDYELDSMSLLDEQQLVGKTAQLTAESVAEADDSDLLQQVDQEAAQDGGDCISPSDEEYHKTAVEITDGGELGGTNNESHDEEEVPTVATDHDIIREEEDVLNQQGTEKYSCNGASISLDAHSCCSDEQSDESCTEESCEELENEQQEEEVSSGEDSTLESKARKIIRRNKANEEVNDIRDFNPREPQFLDVEPDPDAEKVDLRHQELDERKNSDEWMIDHALQQAVTKLAPSRRRKVALLVEAFETVMPLPPYEKPLRNSAPGFMQARFMQACI